MIPRFQPILDVFTQRIIGYEATIGGENGETAQELFNMAHREGRVVSFDQQIRRLAIDQGMKLLQKDQKLFVNITIESLNFPDTWFDESVDLSRIVLEISEQASLFQGPKSHLLLESLLKYRNDGLEIALDDYGRGFHSLESLIKLPLTYIKLDRVFAQEIRNPMTADVVKFFGRMCQDANIRVIVEGIETFEQKQRLLDLGIRYMQGFYFSYPKTLSEYTNISLAPLSY